MKKLILLLGLLLTFGLTACTEETYQLRFMVEDTVYQEVDVIEGNSVREPIQPTKEGHTFLGWYSDSSYNVAYDFSRPVNGSMDIYAKFELQQYNFSIDFGYSMETVQVEYGEDITDPLEVISMTSDDELEFYTDENHTVLYDLETMPDHDVTLYSVTIVQVITITFDSNGGTSVSSIIREVGTQLPTLPTPTKTGYLFEGWKDANGDAFDQVIMPEEDITLYAEWSIETIAFGLLGPLEGSYALYGQHVLNGALLAMEEINAAGGVLGFELEIISYNTSGDAAMGVNAYNRLIDEDGIDALIGGTFSGVTLAIKELAVQDGIPVLTPTATNPDVTLNAANVFRACYTDQYQGRVAATFASTILDVSNVAVVFNRDDAYSVGLAQAFMDEFDSLGLVYTEFQFGYHDDDFSTIINNIIAGDTSNGSFDAVYLPMYVNVVNDILVQADTLGLDLPFIGGDGWNPIEEEFPGIAEGHYYTTHFTSTDPTTIVQDFVMNFTSTYGEDPNALSALGYDAVFTMVAAFEAAGTSNYQDVVTALANITLSDIVTGSIRFDDNGDPIKSISVIQIVSGEQVVIAKIEAPEE